MVRIIFGKGKQRTYLDGVMQRLDSPSLRGLLQFGISTNYSSLKNLYSERRSIPKELFLELCELSKIDPNSLEYHEETDSWGQAKGGRISKRTKSLKVLKKSK